jgi:hypothetical protein
MVRADKAVSCPVAVPGAAEGEFGWYTTSLKPGIESPTSGLCTRFWPVRPASSDRSVIRPPGERSASIGNGEPAVKNVREACDVVEGAVPFPADTMIVVAVVVRLVD